MDIVATAIPDVKELLPVRLTDNRGFFSETYNLARFTAAGITATFVQDNHSLSYAKYTVRGLHFQLPPFAQDKLVRVTRGSAFDVALDLRRASPTFGKSVALMLSAERWNQLFIPVGFAHGYCTLEPNTEVVYKTSTHYVPESERGILWNDPALDIAWPFPLGEQTVSDRDQAWPVLGEAPIAFGAATGPRS
ncbi:MAG TPA: dTDP-4-dehydrorhamnose 3,5-epimerase [Magnetospirillaceae bacterium]|jgi:dTDP-4-dehydrorhamnose 3,5-epimerase